MIVKEEPIILSKINRRLIANERRTISSDGKLKLQFTGPSAEILFNAGPSLGKKWDVQLSLTIYEEPA